jgi:hypothetical protein
MRQASFVVIISLAVLSSRAFGQPAQVPPGVTILRPSPRVPVIVTPKPPETFSPAQRFRYDLVFDYMRQISPLQVGDQVLAGMGDEAAADITLISSARSALSAAEMQTVMDIVHKSFVHPRAIQVEANRKPTASLALLQKLELTAVDQLVKERIAAERTFLNAVPQTLPPLTLPANRGTPSGRNPLGLAPR